MTITLGLLATHFVGDFLLQSNWMAVNKSKDWRALLWHVLVYSACFVPFYGVTFAAVTFWLHIATDAFTSRLTAKLWFVKRYCMVSQDEDDCGWEVPAYDGRKRHWFFVVVGADQLLHYALLAWTLQMIQ